MERAVILLSGGLDSTTCLAYARNKGLECYALSFDYGQRHVAELNAARKIAVSMEVAEHKIFQFAARDLLKGSALTDDSVSVPDYRGSTNIPVTYVPARNTVFLAIALGWAEALGADSIFIGVSSVDYSGYPDCRPEFIKAFQDLIQVATKAGVEGRPITIETPLIHLSKEETIKMGAALGVDYSLTVSCYQTTDDGLACGRCDSCYLRRKGFMEAGVKDPTRYVSG